MLILRFSEFKNLIFRKMGNLLLLFFSFDR